MKKQIAIIMLLLVTFLTLAGCYSSNPESGYWDEEKYREKSQQEWEERMEEEEEEEEQKMSELFAMYDDWGFILEQHGIDIMDCDIDQSNSFTFETSMERLAEEMLERGIDLYKLREEL